MPAPTGGGGGILQRSWLGGETRDCCLEEVASELNFKGRGKGRQVGGKRQAITACYSHQQQQRYSLAFMAPSVGHKAVFQQLS